MSEKKGLLNQYNKKEIKQLLQDKVRMVYVDNGSEEFVARYEDLPDIIVDINQKLGYNENLKVYDFENPDLDNPLLTTSGYFLFRCEPKVREDIIDRLVNLQQEVIKVKDYKVIDEDILEDVRETIEQEEMER